MNKDDILAYLRERYTYDAETGAIRHKGRDRALKVCKNSAGYTMLQIQVNNIIYSVTKHRAAWALYYGRWPTEIDHLNGIRTDNRICNLREVSHKENTLNRVWKWMPNTTTGLPGVCYDKSKNDYHVTCGKTLHFRDKYEAFITTILLGRMYE